MAHQARIDFDEDMPELDMGRLVEGVRNLQKRVGGALETSQRGQLLSKGLQANSTDSELAPLHLWVSSTFGMYLICKQRSRI